MSTNMTLIETKTVGSGGAANIEFTSIPQTYTDLYLVCSLRMTEAGTDNWAMLTFNNIGGTSNNAIFIRGNGSTAVSASGLNADFMRGVIANGATSTASTFASGSVYIPNYTSTTTNKSASIESAMENNATYGYLPLTAALVTNTAAVTSIKLVPFSGTWVQHSSASLYGISNVTSTTKATGGIVSSDGTYNYHMFPYSGTFTPTQNITADVLVIAGGGGGGHGGGGAGGLRGLTSQSLTNGTAYTCTIGAGGNGSTSITAPANGTSGGNSSFAGSGLTTITASGGGAGAGVSTNGIAGGSGGGAGGASGSGSNLTGGAGNSGSYSPVEGYAGGNTSTSYNSNQPSGGGGGAGAVGTNATASTVSGNGGAGVNTYSSWATATQTGVNNGYYAGGGGGGHGASGTAGVGGLGGGGNGVNGSLAPIAGLTNTGSGGGGGNFTNDKGGNGGSGLVIIRYAI